ncbi:hypothetical protein like AT3G13690 [Hibiscus trionum]|uniref:Uncharacterized protein n=1 Tax=Hibiscus trionum TaxID=183268 RepID=A0A9W7HQN5_HIBTR|nr:hypothetical protein like AT3G13690 [Hibiscus trionum]
MSLSTNASILNVIAQINVKIKIVSRSQCGAVAAEAKQAQASWVVLDKQLKHEEKCCMKELQCNIVIMKHSQEKVLRLNLFGASEKEVEACQLNSETYETSEKHSKNKNGSSDSIGVIGPVVTPTSIPELGTSFTSTTTEARTSSLSSSDPGTSPFCISERNADSKKEESLVIKENQDLDESISDTENESVSLSSVSLRYQPWITEYLTSHSQSSQYLEEPSGRANFRAQASTTKALMEKFSKHDREAEIGMSSFRGDIEFNGNVREAVALSRNSPPCPPPLCSICQHKAPVFGKPPRWFTHVELELATGGFFQDNY